MAKLRVSEINVQIVMLDEYDAIIPGDPQPPFKGNAEGTAVQHLIKWLEGIDTRLEKTALQLEAMQNISITEMMNPSPVKVEESEEGGDGTDT